MKKRIVAALRSAQLLGPADWLRYHWHALQASKENSRFLNLHPDFRVPSPDFLYEVSGSAAYQHYRDTGLAHAQIFWRCIGPYISAAHFSVCEWGCGVGRIIRHLRHVSLGRVNHVVGTDYNTRMIDWCRAAIPDIEFHINDLMPPTRFRTGAFDALYCCSVFTHLSEAAHRAWMAEIARIVKPRGIFVFTTHSDPDRLLPVERRAFDAGDLVVRAGDREGGRIHVAYASPVFVRTLLKDHQILQHVPGALSGIGQDVWVARMG